MKNISEETQRVLLRLVESEIKRFERIKIELNGTTLVTNPPGTLLDLSSTFGLSSTHRSSPLIDPEPIVLGNRKSPIGFFKAREKFKKKRKLVNVIKELLKGKSMTSIEITKAVKAEGIKTTKQSVRGTLVYLHNKKVVKGTPAFGKAYKWSIKQKRSKL